MASVDFDKVRKAFRTKLKELNNLPPFAWQNRPYDPEAKKLPNESEPEMYVEEQLVEGPQPVRSTGFIETNSMMIYTTRVPINEGTEEIEAFTARLASHFEAPMVLSFQGLLVKIQRTEQMPGSPDGQKPRWYKRPVYISFMVHVDTLLG